ncbi:MAG TPA: hypothetical protein VHJ19_03625 [Gammaproteobacteria bacterium]|nr:hypothetical protein [Gammaproteobacteria bacterium]
MGSYDPALLASPELAIHNQLAQREPHSLGLALNPLHPLRARSAGRQLLAPSMGLALWPRLRRLKIVPGEFVTASLFLPALPLCRQRRFATYDTAPKGPNLRAAQRSAAPNWD